MAIGSSKHMRQAAKETVRLDMPRGMTGRTNHMPQAAEETVGMAKTELHALLQALALAMA